MKKIIIYWLSILLVGGVLYGENCSSSKSDSKKAEATKVSAEEKIKIKQQKKIDHNQKHFNIDKGIMLDGYDVVSYHSAKGPVEGAKKHALTHEGVVYYFKDLENKKAFEANPEKYIPTYGGWCAYAVAEKGKKVSVDPKTYKIVDGKLYLFYNSWGNNTLEKWNKHKDEQAYIKQADSKWGNLVQKKKGKEKTDK